MAAQRNPKGSLGFAPGIAQPISAEPAPRPPLRIVILDADQPRQHLLRAVHCLLVAVPRPPPSLAQPTSTWASVYGHVIHTIHPSVTSIRLASVDRAHISAIQSGLLIYLRRRSSKLNKVATSERGLPCAVWGCVFINLDTLSNMRWPYSIHDMSACL